MDKRTLFFSAHSISPIPSPTARPVPSSSITSQPTESDEGTSEESESESEAPSLSSTISLYRLPQDAHDVRSLRFLDAARETLGMVAPYTGDYARLGEAVVGC